MSVKSRYHRSINLIRDFDPIPDANGYLLTKTGHEISHRILSDLSDPQGNRAWSITGPYGTGKSSFALFLARILSGKIVHSGSKLKSREELNLEIKPFTCVLINGHRNSLSRALLQGLYSVLLNYQLEPNLAKNIEKALSSTDLTAESVVSFYEKAVSGKGKKSLNGIALFIDEFGKFLEFASFHPESDDIYILQELAELAARSDVPFIIITILHTAFNSYLQIGDSIRSKEWSKIQGRFQDISFLEPPEHMLTLVNDAIQDEFPKQISSEYNTLLNSILESSVFRNVPFDQSLTSKLGKCQPLHPITSLILWPLFRSELAQNERSLFSFLTSSESFGLQFFLSQDIDEKHPQLYSLDLLYDYITSSMDAALYCGRNARKWAEINSVLEKLPPNAPSLSKSIIKVIGLLGLFGEAVGLRANAKTIRCALMDSGKIKQLLNYLEGKSLIIFRKHLDAYGIWEGSDLDVEEIFKQGLEKVGNTTLFDLVTKRIHPRPFVAKRHYFETGYLRTFKIDIVDSDPDRIESVFYKTQNQENNGRVIYIIPRKNDDRSKLLKYASELNRKCVKNLNSTTIWAIPKEVSGLEESLIEVEAWNWVKTNIKELQGDPSAKKEVKSRLQLAETKLLSIIGETFGLGNYSFRPQNTSWIIDGKELDIHSSYEFQKQISRLFDAVYSKAPKLTNELINRNRLSSTVAAARNILLKAMVNFTEEDRLALKGFPPEVSIYESILSAGGFHRKKDQKFGFHEPNENWIYVWDFILGFLANTTNKRKSVSELYRQLKLPPFGLREGPLPLILTSVLINQNDTIAIYSRGGVFIPELSEEVVELLARNPQDFEIQKFCLSKKDEALIKQIAKKLDNVGVESDRVEKQILRIVRPLVVFIARLPNYTKNTNQLEEHVIELRNTLIRARDPYALVFDSIPSSLGLDKHRASVNEIAEKLSESIFALSHCYPLLLDNIQKQVSLCFGLSDSMNEAYSQLKERAANIEHYTVDQTLRLFTKEILQLGDRDWREVVGRIIQKGLPPAHWSDADRVEFQVRLKQIHRDFIRLEEIVAEKNMNPPRPIVRIGILDGEYRETRETISYSEQEKDDIDHLAKQIRLNISGWKSSNGNLRMIRLAALAKVVEQEIKGNK